LAAIKRDRQAIEYIENPTDTVLLYLKIKEL